MEGKMMVRESYSRKSSAPEHEPHFASLDEKD